MTVLLELEFTQACCMMADAERVTTRGDFSLFEKAQHIMTLLLSATNATGYMHAASYRRTSAMVDSIRSRTSRTRAVPVYDPSERLARR